MVDAKTQEEWKAMTDADRKQHAIRVRRKIRKWMKKHPNMPLPQSYMLSLLVAERIIKKKGKYEETVEVDLGFSSKKKGKVIEKKE